MSADYTLIQVESVLDAKLNYVSFCLVAAASELEGIPCFCKLLKHNPDTRKGIQFEELTKNNILM